MDTAVLTRGSWWRTSVGTMASAVIFTLFFLNFDVHPQCVLTEDGSGIQSFALLAGQTINTGTVTVTLNGANIEVKFSTIDGWEFVEAHLWVGNNMLDLPHTKTGNPIPGQFPLKSGDISGQSNFTFAIPLSNQSISFSCPSNDVIYYMGAHASLRRLNQDGSMQTETGWSDGSPITSKGNWASFSTFTLTCMCNPDKPLECETAFARQANSNTCFIDLGFQRWGWTNGPLSPGNYEMDIYAGAGQCDIQKGALAGTLKVHYDGSKATVMFVTSNGWIMNETQLYVGNAPLPKFKQGKNLVETVAPGQYPYIHDDLAGVTQDEFTVTISGTIYIVAHAVTCR